MNTEMQNVVSRIKQEELLQEAARDRLFKEACLAQPDGQKGLGSNILRYARQALASLAALGFRP
jgi:hypothetical protein